LGLLYLIIIFLVLDYLASLVRDGKNDKKTTTLNITSCLLNGCYGR
jgi:hypothetical protein